MAKVKRPPLKLTRKQLRKQQRMEKKKRKHQAPPPAPEEVTVKSPPTSKQNIKPKVNPVLNSDKAKFQKLQRSMNIERIKRLKEDNLREDKLIRGLEKKLKLNIRKKKLVSKSFVNDGLDYLLEVCDFDNHKGDINLEAELNDLEMKSKFPGDATTVAPAKLNETTLQDDECDNSDNLIEEEEEEKEQKISKSKRKRNRKKEKLKNMKVLKSKKENDGNIIPAEEFSSADECGDETLEVCDFDNHKGDINLEAELNDVEMKSKFPGDATTAAPAKLNETTLQDDECDNSDNLIEEEEEEKEQKISKSKRKRNRKKEKLKNMKVLKSKKENDGNIIPEEEFSSADDCGDETSDSENVLREDIYGRLRKNDGTVVENKNKYIPPQLRNTITQTQSNSEKLMRLKKQMKGLLNRLTGKNMHSIASQIEQMYGCNSRHDANSTLTELLIESVISPTFSPMRIIIEHALLISILHANVGIEVGSYVLQKCVEEYRMLMTESALLIEDKRIDNVIAILAQLYNFKVFHACLIYEILDELLERFQEKDIDLVLLIFKNVGFNLRKDDPSKLKEVIFKVQKKANFSTAHSENSRTKFMLETLLAIKNNNRLKVLQTEADYIESLKKLAKAMLNSGKYVSELRITLEDLLNVETKGRWWIVGSAWQGSTSINEKTNLKNDSSLAFDEKLLNLARKHRMSTDVRKNIFCILMSAEDFMDAFEKLLKLGLKGNQSQEVIYVTMHCLLQEKVYNPYYSFIAEQFSSLNRKYQLAIQFCSWDKFKEIDSLNQQQISNLAQFLAYLIQNKKLSLSVLKVLQFTEMDKSMLRLIRQLLLSILLSNEETVIAQVFASISKSDALFMLRESLQLFLHRFILKETKNNNSGLNRDQLVTLPKKVEVAENAMRATNSQNDFN